MVLLLFHMYKGVACTHKPLQDPLTHSASIMQTR